MQRSAADRFVQSLAFETGGLLVAVPLYQAAFGRSEGEGLALMLTITFAVLLWNPLHNRVFDAAELRLTGRAATERPHALRVVHAVTHELSPIIVTLPLIMVLGQHSLNEALTLNAGLTVLYVAYAYVFYLTYDRLFPSAAPSWPDPRRGRQCP
jgi:uncharacterized membrane protein